MSYEDDPRLEGPYVCPGCYAIGARCLPGCPERDAEEEDELDDLYRLDAELEPGDDEVACRVCGCTEHRACATPNGSCFWVEADLCSACARSS